MAAPPEKEAARTATMEGRILGLRPTEMKAEKRVWRSADT